MALFSLHRYAWNFPSNNHGQIFGIADSGVETFNGTPIKSLAREICQNSIDANLKNGEPTRIIFRTFEIALSAIPGFDDLDDAFSRSLEYWSKQKSTKAKSFFQSALKLAQQPKITCLRISDTLPSLRAHLTRAGLTAALLVLVNLHLMPALLLELFFIVLWIVMV